MSSPATPAVECTTITTTTTPSTSLVVQPTMWQRRRRPILVMALIGLVVVVTAAVVSIIVWALTQKSSTVIGPDSTWGQITSPHNESITARYHLWSWNGGQTTTGTTTSTTTNAVGADPSLRAPVLKVLIIDNLPDKFRGSVGHSSSETNYALETGYVYEPPPLVGDFDEGQSPLPPNDENVIYNFTAVTWRNGTVVFQLNNVQYDLSSKGTMFLVTVEPNQKKNNNTITTTTTAEQVLQVVSIPVDLSNVVDDDQVQAFSRTNVDVIAYWEQWL